MERKDRIGEVDRATCTGGGASSVRPQEAVRSPQPESANPRPPAMGADPAAEKGIGGRIAFFTNIVSPHQTPWCRELARLVGGERFRYVYSEPFHDERRAMGWRDDEAGLSCLVSDSDAARDWSENADVLIYDGRDLDLFERRAARGLMTFCMSERWFKPRLGRLRLLLPSYRRMADRFRVLVREGFVTYLPCGVWAARDMAWLCLRGDERRAVYAALDARDGAWRPMQPVGGCGWIRMWGYFVAPAESSESRQAEPDTHGRALRVLWVGRLLAWKRVDTLFKAASACLEKFPLVLTVVGDGPERARLERLGRRLFARHPSALDFRHSVPIDDVRALMRSHDVYVLPSNGYEGWGAVVSEAMEEGMDVLGTLEAGSSATMLPRERLFRAGDGRRLAELLARCRGRRMAGETVPGIGAWSAASAARSLLEAVKERM